MTQQIPGVPEGWEAVSFDYVSDGECWLDKDGDPIQHTSSVRTQCKRLIVRKIEKPAAYRPFKDAEEFKPHRDRWARVIKEHNMSGCDLDDWLTDSLRFMGQDETGVCAPGGWLTYGCAFDCFVFDDDGTPFGVRIDE
jgi:hypothetical protein